LLVKSVDDIFSLEQTLARPQNRKEVKMKMDETKFLTTHKSYLEQSEKCQRLEEKLLKAKDNGVLKVDLLALQRELHKLQEEQNRLYDLLMKMPKPKAKKKAKKAPVTKERGPSCNCKKGDN